MKQNRLRSILVCALLAFAPSLVWPFPDRFDADIKRAAERYLPEYDWRLWKAQLYQESLLDPSAVSPVGARGLAQFMPATWAEVVGQLGYEGVSPHAAGPAIVAGAYYMARQVSVWKAPRPASDRYSLAAASYNAGAGNIITAQRVCRWPIRLRRYHHLLTTGNRRTRHRDKNLRPAHLAILDANATGGSMKTTEVILIVLAFAVSGGGWWLAHVRGGAIKELEQTVERLESENTVIQAAYEYSYGMYERLNRVTTERAEEQQREREKLEAAIASLRAASGDQCTDSHVPDDIAGVLRDAAGGG